MKSNLYIDKDKEFADINSIVGAIEKDNWITQDTIIVTCSPQTSSILSQSINHKLRFPELLENILLHTPDKDFSQVWDPITKEYQSEDKYLKLWVNSNIKTYNQYLIVDCGYTNMRKIELHLKTRTSNYKIASLYSNNGTPYYCTEKYNGDLIFHWLKK